MKIEGQISILISRDNRTTIEVRDKNSTITFVEITLTNDQLASALSRLAHTPCEIEVRGLDKVGKKMEMDTLTFEVDAADKETAAKLAIESCKDSEWVPDTYFGSQNSFTYKEGKITARTTIRRWV